MIGGIVEILVGIVFTVIAILNFKGNISMLHSYHMNNIKEEDKPIFAKRMGIGMLIVGIYLTFLDEGAKNEFIPDKSPYTSCKRVQNKIGAQYCPPSHL